MKIKDLVEKIEAVDPSGTVGAKELRDYCAAKMRRERDSLQDKQTAGSSRHISSTMRATISGEVTIVRDYIDTQGYGGNIKWDLCLKVGNAVKADALEIVKGLYNDFMDEAKGMEPTKLETFKDVFHAYFDDGSVSCKYEYASSYSWIAIRYSAKTPKTMFHLTNGTVGSYDYDDGAKWTG
jgi:hypothetical protein